MSRINIKKNIAIERNVIEKFLIKTKDFIKGKSSLFFYSFLGFIIICIMVVGGVWKFSQIKAEQLIKFELILENYEKNIKSDKNNNNKKTINDLIALSKESSFGFVNEMIYYVIGNLYFKEREYNDANKYLIKFAGMTSSTIFKAMALFKAAISLEETNNTKDALNLYKEIENKYGESEVNDQVLFNIARAYMKENNVEESKKYYNKVISLYPNSIYSEKAKKRLILTGMKKIIKY